jgi:hypothetical protein
MSKTFLVYYTEPFVVEVLAENAEDARKQFVNGAVTAEGERLDNSMCGREVFDIEEAIACAEAPS